MRKPWNACAALLLLSVACGDDDNKTEDVQSDGTLDAGPSDPSGEVPGADAGAGDAATPPSGSEADVPPPEQGGKRLYAVRFDLRAGDAPFGCGKPAALGTTKTRVEPTDARLYVHDVTLVRSNGERVPLELHQDGRWQRERVALVDFVDDTGKCRTANPETRKVVYGYAPQQGDYTGVSFKVGVPAEQNHLNGAEAPAPYNASGMWWSWSGGYKYVRLDLTSPEQENWYLHSGAAGCSGLISTGFQCAARQIPSVDLLGWDPNSSVVVFDAEKLYATSDLSKAADSTPGCMGGKDDTECKPILNALGLEPWNDAVKGPEQTVFQIRAGTPWTLPAAGSTPARKPTNDPNVWPDPSYVRNAALNVPNVSKASNTRSHPVGDPRHGVSCMRCHQSNGPGLGIFTAAGSVFHHDGSPATDVRIEILSGTADRANQTFRDVKSYAILEVDRNGNFYTTEPLPYDQEKLTARILGPDDTVRANMYSTKQTGACNTCHTGGFRIEVPPLGQVH